MSRMRVRHGLLLGGLALLLYFAFASSRPISESDPLEDAARAAQNTGVAGDGSASDARRRASGRVQVDFYGESLCPDCQNFVLNVLTPMMDSGIAELMHLRYIAFGKVRNTSEGLVCQHGPPECKYNRYINCAQSHHPDMGDWFPYVHCLAKHMHELDSTADSCAAEQSWDPAQISGCAAGNEGAALEAAAAPETWGLEPKLTSVPWIVINGVPVGDDVANLDRYVCAASPHANRPQACFELPSRRAGS